MAALKDREAKYNEEKKLFSCLVDLLSYEKITFNGELIFFKPRRYFCSPKFFSLLSRLYKIPKNKNGKYFPAQKDKLFS